LREERRLRVFENRVLRRIFGSKSAEVTEKWRKLHNEELNDLQIPLTNMRVIKSRRLGLLRHVAGMGEGEMCTGFCVTTRRNEPTGEYKAYMGR
jgi:hypothetical protein